MTFFGGVERRDASFQGIHNPFENPTVPLSSLALDSIFGAVNISDTGQSVTEDTSLGLPIVWRCIQLLSTVIASCDIRSYIMPGREEIFPRMLAEGTDSMTYTQFELWELVVVHLATWGNAFVRKVRANGPTGPGSGMITDLIPIHPSRVEVKLDNGNKIFLVRRVKPDGTIDTSKPPIPLTTFEIMHIPGMGYDGMRGLSPIDCMRRTIGTAIAGDKLAARFYRSGSQLSGVIQVKAPLTDQVQADSIRNRWQQTHGGIGHAGDVAVLDAETTFMPITIPPDQLQFLESRRWETTEVARIYGVPPHLVGDVEKSTSWGTGIEQQNIGFKSYTIVGWTKRIESRVTREITHLSYPNAYSKFDLDDLMRGSIIERYQAYQIAAGGPWLSRNEIRGMEKQEPKEGLDEVIMPLNFAPVAPDGTPIEPVQPMAQGDNDDQDEDDQK